MGTTSTVEFDSAATTALVTTAETVVAVTPPVSNRGNSDQIAVSGTVALTSGAGTTAFQIRCRRGGVIGGALVGVAQTVQVGAALPIEGGFDFVDNPGEVAGQTYAITVQQVAATGNGAMVRVTGNVQLP